MRLVRHRGRELLLPIHYNNEDIQPRLAESSVIEWHASPFNYTLQKYYVLNVMLLP